MAKKKLVYLDNAATTRVDEKVLRAMSPYFLNKYGNASEPHVLGLEANKALDDSRKTIATFLGDYPETIFFTGSATESINLCHKGVVESARKKSLSKKHIVTSLIEHRAVIMTCGHLDSLDFTDTTFLPVDSSGQIKLEDLEKSIKKTTLLVSIMYVNNEVGTIQPIREIGKLIKKINSNRKRKKLPLIYFHTDATQAIGYLNCNVDYLGVDFLSFSGHKINAPKGVGVLYARDSSLLTPQIDGGGQEKGIRSGTENVPYIVGIAKAITLIEKEVKTKKVSTSKLRDRLIKSINKIPDVKLTGHPSKRIDHIASFVIEGVSGEALVHKLSAKGIIISSGSACSSNTRSPSRILTAMGYTPEDSSSSIRLSLGRHNNPKDVDYVLKVLPEVIEKLRNTPS